jgi:hypothetical protein
VTQDSFVHVLALRGLPLLKWSFTAPAFRAATPHLIPFAVQARHVHPAAVATEAAGGGYFFQGSQWPLRPTGFSEKHISEWSLYDWFAHHSLACFNSMVVIDFKGLVLLGKMFVLSTQFAIY